MATLAAELGSFVSGIITRADHYAKLFCAGLRMPRYGLCTFVQQKMFKVRDLIAAAKAHPDGKSATNTTAITRLEDFVIAFERLRQDEVYVCTATN